ncbi:MAG: putative rane protein, partial [Clostridia bacterium]|nr:putative rane protein [Clostridia bacterium]
MAAARGSDAMSRRIAFGGILTALCVVLVYFAAYLPSGKLSLYALASVTIAISVVELDVKWGAVVYTASAILIFLLSGSLNALLLFAVFFGSYPLLKYFIEKQSNAALEMILKFAAFNLLGVFG